MSALGRWLGSWAGRWYGAAGGEGPPRHLITAAPVVVVAQVGAPTVTPRAVEPPAPPPAPGGWSLPYIPPPRRLRAEPVTLALAVGVPRIGLRLRAGSVAAVAAVGRPLVWPRPMPTKATTPPPDARMAELLREDEELLLMD